MHIFGKSIGSKGWMLEAGHAVRFGAVVLANCDLALRFAGTSVRLRCALVTSSFITNNQLGTVTDKGNPTV